MRKTINALTTFAAITALAMLSARNLAADTQPETKSVTIDNFNFTPQTLTISVGTTVTWTNRDDVPHTVTSDDKKFKSRALDTDEGFSHTFSAPGTYGYYCSIHPHMRGKVVVKQVEPSQELRSRSPLNRVSREVRTRMGCGARGQNGAVDVSDCCSTCHL